MRVSATSAAFDACRQHAGAHPVGVDRRVVEDDTSAARAIARPDLLGDQERPLDVGRRRPVSRQPPRSRGTAASIPIPAFVDEHSDGTEARGRARPAPHAPRRRRRRPRSRCRRLRPRGDRLRQQDSSGSARRPSSVTTLLRSQSAGRSRRPIRSAARSPPRACRQIDACRLRPQTHLMVAGLASSSSNSAGPSSSVA